MPLWQPGRFVRSVAVLAGSTALGQGLQVLSAPLLTRLYTPDDLGVLAVYTAILSALAAAATLQYDMAVPLPAGDADAANLVGLSLLVALAASVLGGIGLWLAGPAIAGWTRTPALAPYLWLLPLSQFGAGAMQALHAWAVRRKAFGPVGRTRVVQTGAQVAVQLAMGWGRAGALGLVLADVAGRLSGGAALWRLFWSDPARRRLRLAAMAGAARRWARFPVIMTAAVVCNMVEVQVPFLLVPAWFGAAPAGMYFLAHRILVLPASLIGGAVGQAFFAEAAGLGDRPAELRRLSRQLCVALLAVNGPVYAGLALLGPHLFPFVFGPEWAEAGRLAQLLAPMVLLTAVASPLSSLILVGRRLHESLLFAALGAGARAGAIWLGFQFGSLYAAVAALAMAGSALALGAIWRYLRVAGVGLRELAGPAGRVLLADLPGVAAAAVLVQAGRPAAAAAVYAAAAAVASAWVLKSVWKDGTA